MQSVIGSFRVILSYSTEGGPLFPASWVGTSTFYQGASKYPLKKSISQKMQAFGVLVPRH